MLIGLGRASAWTILSPLTAAIGYACALGAMGLCTPGASRFRTGWALYTCAILVQSSWLLSHPYAYIIVVWPLLSALLALPYTALCLLILRYHRHTLRSSAGFAAALALIEWGFTCLPCGYSFQSAALHLSWSLWPLQLASVIGGIGLSFLVFWANIAIFYWLFFKQRQLAIPAVSIALIPYLAGGGLYWHKTHEQRAFEATQPARKVAVCHMEEPPDVSGRALPPDALHEQEWRKIMRLVSILSPGEVDLIVLPEGAVPYPAEAPLFATAHLPERWKIHLTSHRQFLSSLDLSTMLGSALHAPILIGLEGREIDSRGTAVAYNSSFFISPSSRTMARYDKQLLLPLGEYIPLSILRPCLSAYGVHDSFSPGKSCVLFTEGPLRICSLICYEETFSQFATAAAALHPTLFVTLSNDCWYPTIRREHFELARLRAVETGIPMVRSCNQGVSGVVDALGRVVASRGMHQEPMNSCMICPLPQYRLFSPYSLLGPHLAAALLALVSAAAFLLPYRSPMPEQAEQATLR